MSHIKMILYVDKLLPPILYTVTVRKGGQVGRNMLQSTLHLK